MFRKLTVDENIRAVLELQHDENGKALKPGHRQAARRSAQRPESDAPARQPAPSLSGGERRRVEIARALATHPRFILLDEPFAGVDPIAVLEIQRIIGFLKERGIGVLITDHNVRETLGSATAPTSSAKAACWPTARRRNHRKRKRAARLSGRTLPHVSAGSARR